LKPGVHLSDLEPRFVCKACGSKYDASRIEFGLVGPRCGSLIDDRKKIVGGAGLSLDARRKYSP
jgi:hypothetical protein